MKKLLNRLSTSGKIEANSLREEDTHSDEEHLDTHFRKPASLPADARDTSQDIKVKKSFSGSGSLGRSASYKDTSSDSPKKKSSNGIKKDKEAKDKDKLNESDDKSLRKSGSRKNSIKKSSEIKNPDSMKSPSLKSIFSSSYEQQRDTGLIESSSDESEDDSVPRSRGNSMHDDDDEYSFKPIRVPSAPGRMATSPLPTTLSTPTKSAMRAASPRALDSPSTVQFAPSSPQYSPPKSPTYAPVPNLPRSMSSPNPAGTNTREVIAADDFDLRFGVGRERTESISDEAALGADFSRGRTDSVSEDAEMFDNGEVSNQKTKSGLFSFGRNTPKKLK